MNNFHPYNDREEAARKQLRDEWKKEKTTWVIASQK